MARRFSIKGGLYFYASQVNRTRVGEGMHLAHCVTYWPGTMEERISELLSTGNNKGLPESVRSEGWIRI